MINTDELTKYRSYFEAWLNIPLEQMLPKKGIILSSHEKRRYKPDGWMLYLPVCGFEIEDALFISCIPELENVLSVLLTGATDSETIPNKPKNMIHIGIDTLQQYRRKGYAAMACTAFIENHLRQGSIPIWECGINNNASRNLAEKLGFRHYGNVFYAATIDISLLTL